MRNEYDVIGRKMLVPCKRGMRYLDLHSGGELNPDQEGDEPVLSFAAEAHGMLQSSPRSATLDNPMQGFQQLLATTKQRTANR
jgi:hypothetical protein